MIMRAKLKLATIDKHEDVQQETLFFHAVCKTDGYDDDGLDENNTYAKFTPSADLRMLINNPVLLGQFEVGQEFYVDFIPA